MNPRMLEIQVDTSNFIEELYLQYERGQYCDVTIILDGFSLSAHKLILSNASLYFRRLFERDPSVSSVHIRHIWAGMNREAWDTILKLIYTGRALIGRELSCHILSIAAKLGLNRRIVETLIEFVIAHHVDIVEEHLLYVAHIVRSDDLYIHLLDFIKIVGVSQPWLGQISAATLHGLIDVAAKTNHLSDWGVLLHVIVEWAEGKPQRADKFLELVMKLRFDLVDTMETANVEAILTVIEKPMSSNFWIDQVASITSKSWREDTYEFLRYPQLADPNGLFKICELCRMYITPFDQIALSTCCDSRSFLHVPCAMGDMEAVYSSLTPSQMACYRASISYGKRSTNLTCVRNNTNCPLAGRKIKVEQMRTVEYLDNLLSVDVLCNCDISVSLLFWHRHVLMCPLATTTSTRAESAEPRAKRPRHEVVILD
ncbi:uncharacterized protein [Amphiura filiformis]|uniref:uncharacterized protein n=1 Tax=Amphiura filiformis TaxID=82378 RepID=UPI003B21DAB4